jgi:hypothetical protein
VVLLALGFVAYLVAPFVLPGQTGSSGQGELTDDFPTSVSAVGDDERTRTLQVAGEAGTEVSLDGITPGQRLVVTGSGFDASLGIYVAICQIPDSPFTKPGPCLGGVPELEGESGGEGAIEWAPSNWINQDWAWRLFGARSYDDSDAGTFTAYIVVPEAVDESANCVDNACGLFTRNDHTALDNRIQDVYLPVRFAQ